MIDKAELKRIHWVITDGNHKKTVEDGVRSDVVRLYEDLKREAVLLYDEVVRLQHELDDTENPVHNVTGAVGKMAKMNAGNKAMEGVLKTIKSGIDARFTDTAGWGRMIDEVLNK